MTDDDVEAMTTVELQRERVRIQRGQARDVRWLLVATVAHLAATTPAAVRDALQGAPALLARILGWLP